MDAPHAKDLAMNHFWYCTCVVRRRKSYVLPVMYLTLAVVAALVGVFLLLLR